VIKKKKEGKWKIRKFPDSRIGRFQDSEIKSPGKDRGICEFSNLRI